ncbi:glycoside hydrolase [Seiridium cupressi]
MAGLNQLPAGVEGVAAFALVYSSASWICSALLIWCANLYREAWSYTSLLAYFALISDTASIIQQSFDITYYRDNLAGQFYRKTTLLENPELAIANGSYGLDLVLYYIQYYSYNVESMLVMFWAFELAQSVYGLSAKPHLKQLLRRVNSAGKAIAVFFPMLTILLLRAPAIQKLFVVFILLADLPLMISLAVSSITMVAILIRYIQSRKKISNWTPQGDDSAVTNETSTETIQTTETGGTGKNKKSQRRQGLYDRWLMVRFTVAFVILAVFEVTNTLFQLQSVSNNKNDATLTAPDFSVERAKTTFFLFLPGVTPGIFLFLVFGTTAGCRTALRGIFFPKSCNGPARGRRCALCLPWKKSKSRDPEDGTQNPFADSSEAELKEEEASTSPLPVAGLVSKYNRTFHVSHEPAQSQYPRQSQRYSWSQRPASKEGPIAEEADAVELRGVTSLDKIREEYYRPSPEQSDDSGPVLPIMSTREKRISGSQVGLPVSGLRRNESLNEGYRTMCAAERGKAAASYM